MAYTNTSMTYLMIEDGGTYKKLVDISEYPDLGGDPETIDVTTLSDLMTKNILGIQSAEGMEFPSFFTPETFKTLKSYEGAEQKLSVWFGGTTNGTETTPTGDLLKVNFTGTIFTHLTGNGVNEARAMSTTVTATSEFEYVYGTTQGD